MRPRQPGVASPEYKTLALIALGVVALLAVVIWVPKLSFIQPGGLKNPAARARAESDLRGHLLQALAGLVLAVGAYYTGKTFAQNRREQDRNYALAREGQHTERFTRAVEQLADEKLDIRLGGIYALERIAQDSETYFQPVMEVLTAFLRENTRWRREKEAEDAAREPKQPPRVSGPTADFQAVVTVLVSRDRPHYQLDLNRVDLRGASLQEANLSDAHLSDADLSGANLSDANLSDANLSDANLSGANLSDADLSGADLSGARLSDSDLIGADLTGVYLNDTDLTGIYLSGFDLTGAHLWKAVLSEADLSKADLTGANLTHADLTGANLSGANLTEANLTEANLSKAVLTRADVTQQQIASALPDEDTKLP